MTFASPVPLEYLDGTFYNDAATTFYLSPDKLVADYSIVRYERELELFKQHCPKGRVLDVGCSTGGFLFNLNRSSPDTYETWGTDVVLDAVEYAARQGIRVLSEDFLTHSPREGSFDAVTFWVVLEHLLEPRQFLVQAKNHLRSGGKCFVLVPNFRSLAIRLLGSKYRYILPQHLNYFSRQSLIALAGKDFEVIEVRTMHFNPIVILQDWRRGTDLVSDPERATLLKRTNSMKSNPWLGPLKIIYRGLESMIARFELADNLVCVLRKR